MSASEGGASDTLEASSSNGNANRMQVLNISNMNQEGKVVLNDERLLELIQQYPFLYNPRVHPFNDEHYDDWAWKRITNSFQHSYEKRNIKASFSKQRLQQRWQILQPIIKSLSRVNDMSSVPASLRQIVVKMSIQLDDQVTDSNKKPLSEAQKVILSNIDMVSRLPLTQRKYLETEMMELLLTAELDSKGTVRSGPAEQQMVDIEYGKFLKTIHLNELQLPEGIITEKTTEQNSENPKSKNKDKEKSDVTVAATAPKQSMEVCQPEQNMLEPLPPKRWIPLSEVRFHIRKLRVRIKRINVEDYMPLSLLKKSRSIKRET